MPSIHNWADTYSANPAVVTEARSTEELVAIVTDTAAYPSPLRPFGSNHSTTPCALADGGTMVNTWPMNRVLEIGPDFVRVQAGALFIDVSKELERHGLEFCVALQIGNATLGSIACCASKDGSYPGVFGQASAYCTSMTLVTADGRVVTIDESQPELMRAARSSNGLFGIVTEVTFRVRPIRPIALRHELMSIDRFLERLPGMLRSESSIAYYLFPWIGKVVVQERTPTDAPGKPNRFAWKLRNWATAHIVPVAARGIGRLPGRGLRAALAGFFYWCAALFLHLFIRARKTHGCDQTMRYSHQPGIGRFTFSLWGFPREGFETVLRDYVEFLHRHYERTGYRSYMLTVGYHVIRNDDALLSYACDSDVMTIDPTAAGEPGWDEFLDAYNVFCASRGARPLLNQTPRLTAAQARQAFGDRLEELKRLRAEWDPQERFLGTFFRDLLA
jgi:FAD/FMN-containing dehydrogenase